MTIKQIQYNPILFEEPQRVFFLNYPYLCTRKRRNTIMRQDPKHIRISEFNYPLPDERIAKFPLPVRDQSKLLVYRHGQVTEDQFTSLPDYVPAGSLMVFNNTKVIQARLHFRKETGALIEVFCLEPIEPNDYALNFQQTEHAAWLCMVGNLKKWKEGPLRREMTVKGRPLTLTAERGECRGTSHWVDFRWDNPEVTFADILEVFGELPIPPYLNRETQELPLQPDCTSRPACSTHSAQKALTWKN